LHAFLTSEFHKKVTEAYKCIVDNVKGAKNSIKNIRSFVDKTQAIVSSANAGAIPVLESSLRMIIDFSCYHTTFKAAYLHLSKGIKENDNLKKFNFFGKFNGGLIALLGNGKARGIQETKQGSHSKGSTKGGKSSTNSKKEKNTDGTSGKKSNSTSNTGSGSESSSKKVENSGGGSSSGKGTESGSQGSTSTKQSRRRKRYRRS